jgi:hypothetical protein
LRRRRSGRTSFLYFALAYLAPVVLIAVAFLAMNAATTYSWPDPLGLWLPAGLLILGLVPAVGDRPTRHGRVDP